MKEFIVLASTLLVLTACQSDDTVTTNDDWYTRLVGTSGAVAVDQFQNNGFVSVDSFQSGQNGYGTVWYNASTRQCVQMISVDGVVDSALDIQTHPKCGSQSAGGVSYGRPAVGSEYDLTAFQGAKAGQAEMGIQNLGYEAVRTQGLTTYWQNRSTGACARIVTSDGRYSSVTMLSPGDC